MCFKTERKKERKTASLPAGRTRNAKSRNAETCRFRRVNIREKTEKYQRPWRLCSKIRSIVQPHTHCWCLWTSLQPCLEPQLHTGEHKNFCIWRLEVVGSLWPTPKSKTQGPPWDLACISVLSHLLSHNSQSLSLLSVQNSSFFSSLPCKPHPVLLGVFSWALILMVLSPPAPVRPLGSGKPEPLDMTLSKQSWIRDIRL